MENKMLRDLSVFLRPETECLREWERHQNQLYNWMLKDRFPTGELSTQDAARVASEIAPGLLKEAVRHVEASIDPARLKTRAIERALRSIRLQPVRLQDENGEALAWHATLDSSRLSYAECTLFERAFGAQFLFCDAKMGWFACKLSTTYSLESQVVRHFCNQIVVDAWRVAGNEVRRASGKSLRQPPAILVFRMYSWLTGDSLDRWDPCD